jgi:hypothetical protein
MVRTATAACTRSDEPRRELTQVSGTPDRRPVGKPTRRDLPAYPCVVSSREAEDTLAVGEGEYLPGRLMGLNASVM